MTYPNRNDEHSMIDGANDLDVVELTLAAALGWAVELGDPEHIAAAVDAVVELHNTRMQARYSALVN